MSYEAVARRYAQAIFDLGVETSSVSNLAEDIRKIAGAYEVSAEMRSTMGNPLIPESARKAALDEICRTLALSPMAKNAVGLLAERRRLPALPAIAKELGRLSDERAGILRAIVTSAAPLGEAYCQRLQKELERLSGRKILLERRHDPSLIAGVVVKVGDRVIDGSARAALSQIKTQLLST